MNSWVPLLLIASLYLGALQGQVPKPSPGPEFPEIAVSAAWVAQSLGRGVLLPVDARPPAAYLAGHLPGAIQLTRLEGCAQQGVPCLQRELGKLGLSGGETLVLYGDGDSGEAVGTLFWQLESAGFRAIKVLDGGIAAWQAGGGGLKTATRRLPSRPFRAPAATAAVAGIDWVRDHYGLGGIEILDLRDEGVWMDHDYAAPSRFAAGHIPHALPYDFRGWLSKDGRWPDPAAMRAALSRLGPRPDTYVSLDSELVLYGEGPETPSLGLGYLLLRRMGIPVRVFSGGFRAWSKDGLNPIVRIVGAPEVKAMLEKESPDLEDWPTRSLMLLDLREAIDFRSGHVPGAYNLPAYELPKRFEEVVQAAWPNAERSTIPLILYCYGRGCIRSRDSCTFAARVGFNNLLWFRDGLDDWTRVGLSMTPPAPAP
jgi:thiosulfate/3-mercaptopyruvate sulfurtransferase